MITDLAACAESQTSILLWEKMENSKDIEVNAHGEVTHKKILDHRRHTKKYLETTKEKNR